MSYNNIFITVGTTKFDKLIEYCSTDEMCDVFKNLNCKKLTLQHGKGDSKILSNFSKLKKHGIDFEAYTIKDSITEDILLSDLIISHAGAGTCLEVLNAQKPLLVIINEDLMDNHQIELAEQLAEDGYLYYCTVQTLKNTLENDFKKTSLEKYIPGNAKEFVNNLNNLMGYMK